MSSWLARVRHRAQRTLRERFHVEVTRVLPRQPPELPRPVARPTKRSTQFDVDAPYYDLLAEAQARSGTPVVEVSAEYAERMYLLLRVLDLTNGVDGLVAECGVYRGLSSFLLCHRLREEQPGFAGDGFHGFDSFEGISDIVAEDALELEVESFGVPRERGQFQADFDIAHDTLAEYPAAELYKGWLPEVLNEAPEGPYRVVHLDMDLHDPTRAGLEFFQPRLSPGGAILVDDFGAVRWPGVRRATESYCAEHGAQLLRLPIGQAIVFATPALRAGAPGATHNR